MASTGSIACSRQTRTAPSARFRSKVMPLLHTMDEEAQRLTLSTLERNGSAATASKQPYDRRQRAHVEIATTSQPLQPER